MDVQPSFFRQSGISLIESLIAVLVLSIGLLGIAGLHILSLSSSQSALYRTRAVILADDLLQRMQANRGDITAYNWNIAAVTTPATDISAYAGASMQAMDLGNWSEMLGHRDTGLPQGSATVLVVPDASTTSTFGVTIVIQWLEQNETQQYRLQSLINQAT